MANPFIGEIRLFAGTYAPNGWFFCQGQELPANQYQALYSIIGNTYGGTYPNTFKLPNLWGKAPMGWGSGSGLTPRTTLGETGGAAMETLNVGQMPSHTHTVHCTTNPATASSPENGIWAKSVGYNLYSAAPNATQMAPNIFKTAGGSQAHTNLQPYLGINYIISWDGDYPVNPM